MVDLTFRTIGPWGAGKGANLADSEVDNNFWSLAEAIFLLQNDPATPNGIASIAVSGTQMTITLHDGTVLGPYTLPVLTFRWRGEWTPATAYAELDVFTVVDAGIFMVQIAHTSGATFDAALEVGGLPALVQLFGSVDASLSGLSDVELTDLADEDFLSWDEMAALWRNVALGTMAYQYASAVDITGGTITGMPPPTDPGDVATKAYVDSLPAGMTAAVGTMMANASGSVAPAIPTTLTEYLDFVLAAPARGSFLVRGAAGWGPLLPGADGLFLQTHAAGADPTWEVGGSGVTSIDAGPGIDTGGGPIDDTGTISLAEVADGELLANTAGVAGPPTPSTLTLFLDHVLTNARGTILTRTIGGWVALTPGTTGQYLKTLGTAADLMWDSPAGSGTVTSVAASGALTTGGAPITGAGTVSMAAIAAGNIVANSSGSSAAPAGTTATLLFDRAFGTTQGAVLYRSASAWVMLTPGTAGQILTTGGAAANPAWANAPAGAAIAAARILSNITGGAATAIGNTLSDILDSMLGSSRGMIGYRGAAGWAALAAGTAGQVLQSGGAAGDPSWATAAGDVVGPGSAVSGRVATFSGTTGKLIADGGASIADLKREAIQVAVSDETTTLTAGVQKVIFHMPFALTLTTVRASLNTVSSSGVVTVDINQAGASILSTKLTVDASESTSVTAATPAVISTTGLTDDGRIEIDIDTAGTGAAGLKVTLIGTRP